MTNPQPLPRRSLQARLALFYAAGIYVAGIVVLAIVTVPLAGIQSTIPAHSSAPATVTGTGDGIGPHQLLVGSAVALAIHIPIALAAGWFVAGRFLRPLRAITATATAISAGNLHQRLNLGEPADELTELGYILDDLFARLQASFDAHRHFVASASHELRTPSPACAPSSKSPSPTPTPTPTPCARPARRPSPSADTKNGSSKHCSPWPPASAASPAGTPSTSPKSPPECSPPAATKQHREVSTSPNT